MRTNENKAGNEATVSLPASTKLAIELKDITKRFGHVIANSDVNLKVESGTIHGIVGENGAGKSTLMNILFGLYKPCLLYTSPSPRDRQKSRMPSSA